MFHLPVAAVAISSQLGSGGFLFLFLRLLKRYYILMEHENQIDYLLPTLLYRILINIRKFTSYNLMKLTTYEHANFLIV